MQEQSSNQARGPLGLSLARLLVPTDLSAESGKALVYAEAFAQQFQSRIYVLLVVETASFAAGIEALPMALNHEQTIASGQRDLDRWLRSLGCSNPLITIPLVREGKPIGEIVAVATEQEIDLMIVSTHGRRGVKHLLFGSNAEELVRKAPCPIFVVREKEREFLQSVPSDPMPRAA